MITFEPAAVLRCWAIDVDVGGRTYTIPALPASDWLLAVIGPLSDVVPGLLVDADDLDDQLADGQLGEECRTAARAAITAAAGIHWWIAARLADAAARTVIGQELTTRGVDPTRLPFGAYLGAVHRTATQLIDPKRRDSWEFQLELPPAGVAPAEWYDEDAAAAGFMALAARGAGDG